MKRVHSAHIVEITLSIACNLESLVVYYVNLVNAVETVRELSKHIQMKKCAIQRN
jgi:hypothetical protein